MTRIINFLLTFTLILVISLLVSHSVLASSDVNAYLFYGEGCPHCAKERIFLDQLKTKYPNLNITEYEIYFNKENNALFQKIATQLHTQSGGVPFLVIGDEPYIGFSETLTTKEVENKVIACSQTECIDIVAESGKIDEEPPPLPTSSVPANTVKKQELDLPVLGIVDVTKLSLPVLTIILAFLDGFNPCAMWILLFLISLLLGQKDKRRMWILGTTFIVSSALVYFLFLSAWLNLFLFLGYITWIRNVVALVALMAGYFYLKDYFVNTKGGCSVVGGEKRQKLFQKMKQITQTRQFVFALGGIILLAIAVNMIELVCSAGLPAIYTKILSLSELSTWQYYLYLLLYILIFMLDDLIVFVTAMLTLQTIGIESKYSRYSHLVGGILMLLIGVLLIFKPEWLMFG